MLTNDIHNSYEPRDCTGFRVAAVVVITAFLPLLERSRSQNSHHKNDAHDFMDYENDSLIYLATKFTKIKKNPSDKQYVHHFFPSAFPVTLSLSLSGIPFHSISNGI